jgi:TPR repeat protein
VPKDHERAFKLHELAAEAGLPIASFNLGTHYFLGKGVEQNFEKARDCFEAAARQGFAQAAVNLGNMYMNGHGIPRDYAKAEAAYALGADSLDDAKALMEKAQALQTERGTEGSEQGGGER